MPQEEKPEELGPFQFVVLALSFVLLAAIAAEWLFHLPREVTRLIFFIDTAVCIVFLIDFILRFHAAQSKWRFMRWGWIDLLASIPAIEALRWGRIFRIVRIVRLATSIRSFRRLMQILAASKARAGVASAFVITFLVVAFGSIGVLLAEQTPDANIVTAEDAIWWSMTTVTTVGYGDRYPVTTPGRMIATLLMVCGIGLFGTLSGVAAGVFLGEREHPASHEMQERMLARIEILQSRLDALSASATPSAMTPPSTPPHPPGPPQPEDRA